MPIWVGIDWSETHQDWAAVNENGERIAGGRFLETVDGFTEFEHTVRSLIDEARDPLPTVAIETEKGLTVANLRRLGYPVYAINPLKVARYRDRYATTRGKSDKGDAKMLADILRTDPGVHRQVPDNTGEALALGVLSRAHQDEIWREVSVAAEIRSLLRLYYPAALIAYPPKDLATREARLVLGTLTTPTAAAAKRTAGWATLLRESGRTRFIERDARARAEIFRAPSLRVDPVQEAAFGDRLKALVTSLNGTVEARQTIERRMVDAVQQHPYYPLLESIVGIGDVTAARLVGEIGDDPFRFDSADSLRAYAGVSPITRASGRSNVVMRRRVKNNRLTNAVFMWAFTASTFSPGAKAHYKYRKDVGDRHAAALRNLGNRLIGCLWHCLTTGEVWDEERVWGHRYPLTATAEVPADSSNDDEVQMQAAIEAAEIASDEPDAA